MVSLLQLSPGAKDANHSNIALGLLEVEFYTHHLMHVSDPRTQKSLAEISNIVNHSLAPTPVNNASMDNSFSVLSRSHLEYHPSRVATVDCHDMDAWSQEWKVHNTGLDAVATPFALDSNSAVIGDYPFVDVGGISFAPMGPRTPRLPNAQPFTISEDANIRTLTPGSSAAVRPGITVGPYPLEILFEGRRRVGEILTRCGVISASEVSPIEPPDIGGSNTSCFCPVDILMPSNTDEPLNNDGVLITALANWTSEWVYTLVIQPYLRGSFRFQYQGKPGGASTLVASRILRVLSNVHNPVQVAIHALWLISALTGNGTLDDVPFLSIPIFRYLHNNGVFIVEDFMLRTFVACVMIGDKTLNDTTLSINTWTRLTCIPQVNLNATEKFTLKCLQWDVVMTQVQWQDIVTYLRSCIKMGSVFDPFAYDEASPSCIMARLLDELAGCAEDVVPQAAPFIVEIVAPQPVRHFSHWGIFTTVEWCPEEDPVINRKPRTIGIAPGTSFHDSCTLSVGTTAKDLLDSILGTGDIPPTRPAGASFHDSFGVVGAHFAHTIKFASLCQGASWLPSHG